MQFQADILGSPPAAPAVTEITDRDCVIGHFSRS
jgi:hypothetical protein